MHTILETKDLLWPHWDKAFASAIESFIPSEKDIDKASKAVEAARNFTLEICRRFS